MRVTLDLVLPCTADAAWRALRSPAVFTAVSRPFTTFAPLHPQGFPELWSEGDHAVSAKAFGLVPIGEQVISVSFSESPDGTRTVVDAGRGVSGALARVTRWRHTMSVSETATGTRYRDSLEYGAGALTAALWPMYWAFWQWRAFRLKALARHW